MPIVSGVVVPKMNPTSHVGDIRLLRPVVVALDVRWKFDTDTVEVEERTVLAVHVGSVSAIPFAEFHRNIQSFFSHNLGNFVFYSYLCT